MHFMQTFLVFYISYNEVYEINAFYAEIFSFFYISWSLDSNFP